MDKVMEEFGLAGSDVIVVGGWWLVVGGWLVISSSVVNCQLVRGQGSQFVARSS